MQFLSQLDPRGKKVLVRLDLDLAQDASGQFDTTRLEGGLATLEYLWHNDAQNVTVIAHRGIEKDQPQENFSLRPIAEVLFDLFAKKLQSEQEELRLWLTVKENLRFDPREQDGSEEFAGELSTGFDFFVNDAFATAHRNHTSITFLPKILPTYFGLQFEKEIKAFEKVLREPVKPFVFILGGGKLETKVPLLEKMADVADQILIGGKLAVQVAKQEVQLSERLQKKVKVASVTEDTLDTTETAAHEFAEIIKNAKTIIWNGPMGYFEDGIHSTGTKIVAEAVIAATQNGAFSMIGGGDTESALTILNLEQSGNFSHMSSGGGAMMEYLAKGNLVALEVSSNTNTTQLHTATTTRSTMHNFGINGFGRIGRTSFRVWWNFHKDRLDLKLINTSGSMPVKDWVHLMKYDSNYGPFHEQISFTETQEPKAATDENPIIGTITIGDRIITVTAQRDPAKIPWGQFGVQSVIESTGAFTTTEKAGAHLTGGAKKVIISAPGKDGIVTNVIGVSDGPAAGQIFSNASCTTNCITPVAAVMHHRFGVAKAMLTTIHSYTDDQNLHDNSHRDMRRARAAAMNMVPTSTGAAVATAQVIPELKGLFDGLSVRVPTATGSLSDMVFVVKQKTTKEEVNQVLRETAGQAHWAGIFAVTDEPLVSRDIVGRRESCIVDLDLTQVVDGDLVKVVAWYDNEFGYCNRLVEQVGRE